MDFAMQEPLLCSYYQQGACEECPNIENTTTFTCGRYCLEHSLEHLQLFLCRWCRRVSCDEHAHTEEICYQCLHLYNGWGLPRPQDGYQIDRLVTQYGSGYQYHSELQQRLATTAPLILAEESHPKIAPFFQGATIEQVRKIVPYAHAIFGDDGWYGCQFTKFVDHWGFTEPLFDQPQPCVTCSSSEDTYLHHDNYYCRQCLYRDHSFAEFPRELRMRPEEEPRSWFSDLLQVNVDFYTSEGLKMGLKREGEQWIFVCRCGAEPTQREDPSLPSREHSAEWQIIKDLCRGQEFSQRLQIALQVLEGKESEVKEKMTRYHWVDNLSPTRSYPYLRVTVTPENLKEVLRMAHPPNEALALDERGFWHPDSFRKGIIELVKRMVSMGLYVDVSHLWLDWWQILPWSTLQRVIWIRYEWLDSPNVPFSSFTSKEKEEILRLHRDYYIRFPPMTH